MQNGRRIPDSEPDVALGTVPPNIAVNARGQLIAESRAADSSGNAITALPPGRAAAASSVPVVVSTEDKAALNGTFRRAAAVGATPGDALWIQGVTTAGTVTITLVNGGSLTASVPLGSTLLPVGATNAVLGTAVGGTFQSLFFT